MLEQHYSSILKVGYQLKHASDNAMILCHTWNYQGFKRMHELLCIHLEFWCLKLKKEMQDDHEITPAMSYGHPHNDYKPTDLKDHAIKWYGIIKEACSQIAASSTALMQNTGKQSCYIKQYLKCLYKYKEMIRRFIKRAEHNDWMEHDIAVYSDRLHDKLKCYQKKIDKVMSKKWSDK